MDQADSIGYSQLLDFRERNLPAGFGYSHCLTLKKMYLLDIEILLTGKLRPWMQHFIKVSGFSEISDYSGPYLKSRFFEFHSKFHFKAHSYALSYAALEKELKYIV